MKLSQSLEGKTIRLTDSEGNLYEGHVSDYIFADDNEPEVEAIILDRPVREFDNHKYEWPVEFTAPEIKSVEIIK